MGAANSNLSAPFFLILSSSNQTYNGTALEVCNASGKTALCANGAIANSSTSSFVFDKKSSSAFGTDTGTGFVEYLTSDRLQLDFRYSPISNVAFADFVEPQNATYSGLYVAFNGDNLEITDNYDDTTQLATVNGGIIMYNRWLICTNTLYGGQGKPLLNWQLGRYTAENPSCQTVRVNKQMVES
ncbi:hypothetical protein AMS68_003833 [Peltaster fructicola]|uniref:Uncharacterized protein n=1 Tax=Peltaster fructicola TaxID=286661 RepID=A0A6H0XUF4_9PEZI|nr:hypothetical protein AMS68_003833 [Peltaster fructicola]